MPCQLRRVGELEEIRVGSGRFSEIAARAESNVGAASRRTGGAVITARAQLAILASIQLGALTTPE